MLFDNISFLIIYQKKTNQTYYHKIQTIVFLKNFEIVFQNIMITLQQIGGAYEYNKSEAKEQKTYR